MVGCQIFGSCAVKNGVIQKKRIVIRLRPALHIK